MWVNWCIVQFLYVTYSSSYLYAAKWNNIFSSFFCCILRFTLYLSFYMDILHRINAHIIPLKQYTIACLFEFLLSSSVLPVNCFCYVRLSQFHHTVVGFLVLSLFLVFIFVSFFCSKNKLVCALNLKTSKRDRLE